MSIFFICVIKVVSHYDLNIRSMSVMSLKKVWMEGGSVG